MNEITQFFIFERIRNIIHNRFEFVAKVQQIEIIQILLTKKKDLILIVKTKFEKNIIFQISSLLYNIAKIVLIIISLKTLKKKQCIKLKRIENCKSFVLNDDSNKTYDLKRIRQKEFSHDQCFLSQTCVQNN